MKPFMFALIACFIFIGGIAPMSLESQTLGRTGQAQGTRYLLTTALWAQQQKLTISNGVEHDAFGSAVAMDGDTAIIGANAAWIHDQGAQGAAYVFTCNGNTCGLQQRLTAHDGTASDQFGIAVAVDGDTAVIGAYGDIIDGNVYQGSAYIFTRSGGTWSQHTKLISSDGVAYDSFGSAVAVAGDTVVIGAFGADIPDQLCDGAAYVFVRNGGTWSLQQKLFVTDSPGMVKNFGTAVAIEGDTIIIGAANGGEGYQDAAYVFVRNGNTWSQQQKLIGNEFHRDAFGHAVAMFGDTAVIGAYMDWAAYVFVRNGNTWSQQQKLMASDGAAGDFFGTAVAVYGDTAMIGAYGTDIGTQANQGAAYVFMRSGSTWDEQQKLTASDGAADDVFGYSVAVSGDLAVIGAYRAGDIAQGAAYLFTGTKQSGNSYLLWTK